MTKIILLLHISLTFYTKIVSMATFDQEIPLAFGVGKVICIYLVLLIVYVFLSDNQQVAIKLKKSVIDFFELLLILAATGILMNILGVPISFSWVKKVLTYLAVTNPIFLTLKLFQLSFFIIALISVVIFCVKYRNDETFIKLKLFFFTSNLLRKFKLFLFTILVGIPTKIWINNKVNPTVWSFWSMLLLVLANLYPILVILYISSQIMFLFSLIFSGIFHFKFGRAKIGNYFFGGDCHFRDNYFDFFWGGSGNRPSSRVFSWGYGGITAGAVILNIKNEETIADFKANKETRKLYFSQQTLNPDDVNNIKNGSDWGVVHEAAMEKYLNQMPFHRTIQMVEVIAKKTISLIKEYLIWF